MDYRAKLDLTGKLALVTGAGSGLGAEMAEALARTGAEVVCTDMNLDSAVARAKSLSSDGLAARAEGLDVTDSAAIDRLAEALPALDILVCNAGIAHNCRAEEMSDEIWDKMIAINLTGVFKTCRGFGRKMIEAGRGSIINIGSISGHVANVPQAQVHYNSSKAGVHHLTKSLAIEWADRGVRVNAVAPGYVQTPLMQWGAEQQGGIGTRWLSMIPQGRFGQPHEIASVVQFLASDASSMMTGSVVFADAGYTSI